MTLILKPNSQESKLLDLNQELHRLHQELSALFCEKNTHSPWIDVAIDDVRTRQLCWLVDSDPNADTYSLFSNGAPVDPVQLSFKSVRELEIDKIEISPETGWMLIKSDSKIKYPQLEDARRRRSQILSAIAQINKKIKAARSKVNF